jgi:hypothetical protein
MIRPVDQDAFEMVTKILNHRLGTVQAERFPSGKLRLEALKNLQADHDVLQKTFNHLKQHWIAWSYPINNGRQTCDETTPVPPPDAEYKPIIKKDAINNERNTDRDGNPTVTGSAIQGIWESFVLAMTAEQPHMADSLESFPPEENSLRHGTKASSLHSRRLPLFIRLGQGHPICPDRSLPHIRNANRRNTCKGDICSGYSEQSKRCWQSMLLKQKNPDEESEWDIVLDHFTNYSRSKKVLSIIQQ